MNRLLSIGDIHGCAMALDSLLDYAQVGKGDVMVTLGDYVNRGRDSKGVLEQLIALQKSTEVVSLRGNHEVMMLSAWESDELLDYWLGHGGLATMNSYGAKNLHDIPEAHWLFLRSTQPYHETEDFIFVHGNIDACLPLSQQSDDCLYWKKLTTNVRHLSGKIMICGHTPQKSGWPLVYPDVICIDTDVKTCGWLTCLEPLTGRFWQANEDGRRRNGQLDIRLPDRIIF